MRKKTVTLKEWSKELNKAQTEVPEGFYSIDEIANEIGKARVTTNQLMNGLVDDGKAQKLRIKVGRYYINHYKKVM